MYILTLIRYEVWLLKNDTGYPIVNTLLAVGNISKVSDVETSGSRQAEFLLFTVVSN